MYVTFLYTAEARPSKLLTACARRHWLHEVATDRMSSIVGHSTVAVGSIVLQFSVDKR